MSPKPDPNKPFDWTDDSDGPAYAEKMKPGPHFVRIVKLIHTSKDQPDGLRTKKGNDPMFLVICQNAAGEEGSLTLTCTVKAGWMIRKTLGACGADLKAIQAEGIAPADFAYPDVARGHFEGKTLWVTAEENGDYINLDPMKRSDAAAAVKEWFGFQTDEEVAAKMKELEAALPPV